MFVEIDALRRWFLRHRRDLPWRNNPTPYQVWISEVMLQQTQASRVIPFYHKWMERYPTVEALAEAPLDDVIKTWEGLGYYSRARNLHQAAKQMNGTIPSSHEALSRIKGLGPYTIGAIRAFAFKQKASAVDANVLRVLARYYRITDPVDTTAGKRRIEELAYELLPDKEPWLIAEALIELGALICTKKPQCDQCPLKEICKGKGEALPKKRAGKKTIHLHRVVAVVLSPEGAFVSQEKEGRVMAGLWQFPYIEVTSPHYSLDEITSQLEQELGSPLEYMRALAPVSHTFTRYRAHLFPHVWKGSVKGLPLESLSNLPFSSGHRRIAQQLLMVSHRKKMPRYVCDLKTDVY